MGFLCVSLFTYRRFFFLNNRIRITERTLCVCVCKEKCVGNYQLTNAFYQVETSKAPSFYADCWEFNNETQTRSNCSHAKALCTHLLVYWVFYVRRYLISVNSCFSSLSFMWADLLSRFLPTHPLELSRKKIQRGVERKVGIFPNDWLTNWVC